MYVSSLKLINMSSTSVARQNRRMRQQQLSALNTFSPSMTPAANALNSSPSNLKSYEASTDYSLSDENKTNESIHASDKIQDSFASTTGCSFINCDVSSRPIGKVFIEDERGFKMVDANDLMQSFKNEYSSADSMEREPAILLSYKAARMFQNFSNFCHGLLGGMSLIHLLFLTHLITSNSSTEETIRHFGFLSQPVHNIYNFICVICCISAFDRYDVGSIKNLLRNIKKCHPTICIIFIYPLCLVMSLSTINVDEKFWLPYNNATNVIMLSSKDASNEIFYWKTLSILKCVGALIAWILISLKPNHNIFLKYIKNILDKNRNFN